jgi:hypothetical protein
LAFVFIIALILTASCSSRNTNPAELDTIDGTKNGAPLISSATWQHTIYNGKPQPIEALTVRGEIPLIVTYFPSLEAFERNEGGITEAPTEIGTYYVRIERPAGKDYAAGPPVKVEYLIQNPLRGVE